MQDIGLIKLSPGNIKLPEVLSCKVFQSTEGLLSDFCPELFSECAHGHRLQWLERLNPCRTRWRLTTSSWHKRHKVSQRKLGEVSAVIAESDKTNFTVPLAQGHSLLQSTNLLIHYCNRVITLDAGLLLLFNHSVMSNSLQPQGLQYTRLSYSSLPPGVCSNSCPLSQWCHPTISSSVIPFSCLQSFPTSGSFKWVSSLHQVAKLSFSISPSNEYSGLISFQMDWLDLLVVQRTLKSLLQHHSSKASILWCSAFFIVQLSHAHMITGKNQSFDYMDLCQQSDVCFLDARYMEINRIQSLPGVSDPAMETENWSVNDNIKSMLKALRVAKSLKDIPDKSLGSISLTIQGRSEKAWAMTDPSCRLLAAFHPIHAVTLG